MTAPRLGKKGRTPDARKRRALLAKERKRRNRVLKTLFTLGTTGEVMTGAEYLDKVRKEWGHG